MTFNAVSRKAAEEALARRLNQLGDSRPVDTVVRQFNGACEELKKQHHALPLLQHAEPGLLRELLSSGSTAVSSSLVQYAAWLAGGQHGFAALVGIPELQQIISHTCIDVLHEFCCTLEQYSTQEPAASRDKNCQGINVSSQSLLHSLPPQLRICLLAEVAAGLICPGQPLPPDTPEHAAALLAFIDKAAEHLKSEIHQGVAAEAVSFERVFTTSPLGQAIDKAIFEQQQAANPYTCTATNNDMSSPLAPHIDLQLQVPAHVLLEALLLALPGEGADEQARRAFCVRYQLNSAQWEGLVCLFRANPLLVTMDELARQVAKAVREGGTQATEGTNDSANLHSMSSSSSGEALNRGTGTLWQLIRDAASVSSKLPEAESARGVADDIQQLLVTIAAAKDNSAAVGQNFTKHLQLLGGALVFQFLAAARAAGGVAWQQEVPLQVLVLLAALEQLQGMCLAAIMKQDELDELPHQQQEHVGTDHSRPAGGTRNLGGSTSSNAWPVAAGNLRGAGSSDATYGDCVGVIQPNDDSRCRHRAGQSAATCQRAHQQPAAKPLLQAALQKVTDMIRMVREYTSTNAAINASQQCAAADAQGNVPALEGAAAAAGPLPPEAHFGVGSPLSADYPEPYGCGVWAPAATAATAVTVASSSDGRCRQAGAGSCNTRGPATSQQHLADCSCTQRKAMLALQAMAASGMLQQKVQQVTNTLQDLLSGDLSDEVATAATEQLDRRVYYGLQESDRKHAILQVCRQHGLDRISRWQCGPLQDVPAAVADVFVQQCMESMAEAGVPGGSVSVMQHGLWRQQTSVRPQRNWQVNARRAATIKEVAQGKVAIIQLYQQLANQVVQPLQKWLHQHTATHQQLLNHHQQQVEQLTAAVEGLAEADWLPGYNPSCSRCFQENQRHWQQRQEENSSGQQQQQQQHHYHLYSAWPVSYSDPFMWRRLMWQLLGKIKPAAQAWFLKEKNMCAHSVEFAGCWLEVLSSIAHDVWSDPAGEGLPHALLYTDALMIDSSSTLDWRERYFFVKHYARVANLAYTQSYCSPAAVLLSQQVLLSLSPLHQQIMPHAEAAPLCPSSAGAAVSSALMHKLGVGQCLGDFRHETVHLNMWHVWWHVGIRRFHRVKKQRQQQQQRWEATGSHSSSSSSDDESHLMPMSTEVLQELYNDPDARYYAVGFASRQLSPSEQPAAAAASLHQQHFIRQVVQQLLEVCHAVRVKKLASSCLAAEAVDLASRQLGVLCDDADIISRLVTEGLLGLDHKRSAASSAAHSAPELIAGRRQHLAAAVTAGGDVVDTLCEMVSGVADSGHVAQVALLPPLAAGLWVHPREWCRRQAEVMQDELCSWCEQQPGVGAAGLFDAEGWGQDKVDPKELCQECHTFFCCSHKCLGKTLLWHNKICAALCKCRERYRGANPQNRSSQQPLLSRRVTCSVGSTARTSNRHQGYQWRVLELLQWGDHPACEPGPLGVNCLGLLTAQHESEELLVLADIHWRRAQRQRQALLLDVKKGRLLQQALAYSLSCEPALPLPADSADERQTLLELLKAITS